MVSLFLDSNFQTFKFALFLMFSPLTYCEKMENSYEFENLSLDVNFEAGEHDHISIISSELQSPGNFDGENEVETSEFEVNTDMTNAIFRVGLSKAVRRRPGKVPAEFAEEYFARNMAFVEPFLDARFAVAEIVADTEYENFEADTGCKNRCREFWKDRVNPLVEQVGPKFQRLALLGSLNGLTSQITRKMYAILVTIHHLPEEEAAMLLDSCWLAASIGECDPLMNLFPNDFN
jgi:hypothetical protein